MDKNTSVGIVGMGFVGGAIFRGFNLYADVKGYDIDPKKSTHSLEEVANCDFVFVAVPTPMENVEGGKADLSLVEKALKDTYAVNTNPDTVFIIKSTVIIGSTRKFSEELGIKRLVHSPEFLTERAADIDFITSARHIIGGADEDANKAVEKLYNYRFPAVQCYLMGPEEAEVVKYAANCFFATKVMFFNELKLVADEFDLDWKLIMDGVMADGRIGRSHNDVPGHDGDGGFGGKCFPKDINAIVHLMRELGLDPKVMSAVWEQNKSLRKNWDWEKISGAVSKK